MKVKVNFETKFLDLDLDREIVSIASVNDTVVCVDADGKLYKMTFANGLPSFKVVSTQFSFKDNRILSVSPWKSKGKEYL